MESAHWPAPFFLHVAEHLRDVDEADFDLGESVLDLVRAVYTGRRSPAGRRVPLTAS